jgi:thiamine-phosphate pyrophosphorylase
MDLPRLLLIADNFTNPAVAARTRDAVRAGVRWVQLRDHAASTDAFDLHALRLAKDLIKIDRKVLITINSRVQMAEAHSMHFHTGRHGPSVFESRLLLGQDAPIGVSAHDGRELAAAIRDKAQYVLFSPIFRTKTHPEARPVGVEVLRKSCFHSKPTPVYALGGMTPERVGVCLEAGARGVAVHGAIMHAPNIVSVIQAFSRVLPGL